MKSLKELVNLEGSVENPKLREVMRESRKESGLEISEGRMSYDDGHLDNYSDHGDSYGDSYNDGF